MTEVLDFRREIPRNALLERLRRAQPKIIALVAPAGFGKSTLARQFVESHDGVAICDCARVEDDLGFARRIISTLAEEEPDRSATLSQRQLLLGDDSATPEERVEIALAAWRDRARSTIFVFENGERVADLPTARDLFARLLAERPEGRTVIVCSRASLRIHFTRFAAPHQIVTLRADDLAFERADLDELFKPALDAATLDRIYTASLGWPIAVFLLARFAREGRLDPLLERLGDVAFEELHDYLADEVLASLSSDVVHALFAAACIPEATDEDLSLATGTDAGAILAEFGRVSPFVRRSEGGKYVVHPLLAGALTKDKGDRRAALLQSTAQAYEGSGNYLRAAELFLVKPDQEQAARALEGVAVGDDRAPSMRYSRLLSSIDRDLVRRYPTLWSCNALFQMFSTDCGQLLKETQYLWNALPPDTPARKRYYLFATRVLLLSYVGRFEEALAFIEAVAPSGAGARPLSEAEQGYKLYLRGTILARLGRVDEAEKDLLGALPFADRMDVMASAVIMLLGSDVARIRGDTVEERDRIALSLEYARRSELINFVAFRLAESAFGAWLAGDSEGFGSFAEELETIVADYGIRGFKFFAACARSHDDVEPGNADLLRWVLCGHLIAATNAADAESAQRHAFAADQIGETYPNPFLRTLAAVAMAELAEGEKSAEHYDRAYTFAQSAGSPNVLRAVVAARDRRDAEMLSAFVRRFRTLEASGAPRLDISVLRGSVFLSGKEVHLGDRELELVIALSLRPGVVTQPRLLEMLWPDSEESASANALYACLHRLRNRLGDEGLVSRTSGGLRLSDQVRVDLWALDRRLSSIRSRDIANESEYADLLSAYKLLVNDRPARYLTWEWFAPVERHLNELRCVLGLRLGRYALRVGNVEEALALALELVSLDPCDEGAREVAITAYLARGDRSAALQHYRHYRTVLWEELRCEPSPGVAALVGVAPESGRRP